MRGKLIGYLGVAALCFGFAFRGRRPNFWLRMAAGTGSLGVLAIASQSRLLRPRLGKTDLAGGLLSASLLYLVFQIGDRFARAIMPAGESDIAAIYRLRREASPRLIAVLLAAIIAPCEELFWRGYVQRHLQARLRAVYAVPLAATLYAAVHLPSLNPTLTGAAGIAGLFWSLQYAFQKRLAPVMVSHIIWDIWIFLIAPTPGGTETKV